MITPRKPAELRPPFGARQVCLFILVALCLGMNVHSVRADAATVAPSGDTYVTYGRQNDNFSTKTTMWVGYDQSGGYLVERALLAFAPGTLPPRGSTVTSASLHLYLGATTTGDGSMVVSAHRITSNWDPTTVKWPSQPSFALGRLKHAGARGRTAMVCLGRQDPTADLERPTKYDGLRPGAHEYRNLGTARAEFPIRRLPPERNSIPTWKSLRASAAADHQPEADKAARPETQV